MTKYPTRKFKDTDIIGTIYNDLTIIEDLGYVKKGVQNVRMVKCICVCGETKVALLAALKIGLLKSCGCLLNRTDHSKHNMCGTPLYKVWSGMKSRCYIKTAGNYYNYGAKGIKMCKEWRSDFLPFYKWAIANGYSEGLTLDRINPKGNYTPKNCRWATTKQQSNNKTNTIFITHNGQRKSLSEWADFYNLKYYVLFQRYKRRKTENFESIIVPLFKYRRKSCKNNHQPIL